MKLFTIPKPVKRLLMVLPAILLVAGGIAVSEGIDKAEANTHDHAAPSEPVAAPRVAAAKSVSGAAWKDVARARVATFRFHNIKAAKASGYPDDVTGCLEFPDGFAGFGPGGMGHHYVNPALQNDGGKLDVTKPEALLYEPQRNGSLRLIAVEYVVNGSDVPSTGPAPVLFGHDFMWSEKAQAWQLHAYIWKHNAYGMFAPVNPNVSCEFAG